MRAIILAAGAGRRLRAIANGRPKCLIDLGKRRLVDYQLTALRSVGVEDIAMVVGYEAQQIRDHCGDGIRYVHNPQYATTNSIFSLYLARHELDSDTFLFNCDIVFRPEVLSRMLAGGHPNVIAVDSTAQLQAGEMNVQVRDDSAAVVAIGKQLELSTAHAQSVQLVKFDAAGARAVGQEVEHLIGAEERDAFPTSAYGPLIEAERLFAVEVGDLAWSEIDSPEDYDHTVRDVLPRL